MSRLEYLNQMVENNLAEGDDPCAENATSLYKAPCVDDLTDSRVSCIPCCMNTEDSWFKLMESLDEQT